MITHNSSTCCLKIHRRWLLIVVDGIQSFIAIGQTTSHELAKFGDGEPRSFRNIHENIEGNLKKNMYELYMPVRTQDGHTDASLGRCNMESKSGFQENLIIQRKNYNWSFINALKQCMWAIHNQKFLTNVQLRHMKELVVECCKLWWIAENQAQTQVSTLCTTYFISECVNRNLLVYKVSAGSRITSVIFILSPSEATFWMLPEGRSIV